MLVGLYRRENRPADAARVARELSARHEQNYIFKLELADALIAQAAAARKKRLPDLAREPEREAFTIFENLLAERPVVRRSEKTNAKLPADLVRFKYADALLTSEQPEAAAAEFARVTMVADAEPNLVTLARLRAARAFDLAGKRDDALAQYKAVLARPNVYNAHTQAERGLRQPYKRKNSDGDVSGGEPAGKGDSKEGTDNESNN